MTAAEAAGPLEAWAREDRWPSRDAVADVIGVLEHAVAQIAEGPTTGEEAREIANGAIDKANVMWQGFTSEVRPDDVLVSLQGLLGEFTSYGGLDHPASYASKELREIRRSVERDQALAPRAEPRRRG